ncbi:hypothetical protein Cgig2_012024 [Carnegiea gigantea]|uniref:Kinesin motor domain-containing protein n=1 Tax=Carnegiea gigantea TaxID=171969 RepID=A0A9Q1KQN0_9CARY|nr:hypothetical protein Cgig2_012024 [Carnegiea gigantea]
MVKAIIIAAEGLDDKVFGPATTTRHVYDVAAHHVVSGAMEGINGTVFAYGVTGSGKTHTMHGLQKSPGIIPLAIKDVFEMIQETPGREFLLRVSYLEIYNEVINDLLDPTGQNLRIREDEQGTYVEGIKEEVVLSPAHALSLIATGEEHRHVGSNNFNLLSSRSHTIFTLTIESSPRGQDQGEEHLIDLAGSESSKTETNGLRRKEGSYINKSLLTLGTLICTVTPASSNSEETHNTLKFAHRSKHVEVKASQNKILDEKSLIKKYQKEISNLKQELRRLKHGASDNQCINMSTPEDLVSLKLELEAGQVEKQFRLEEEEQAKAALMGRIQRLTKLILVSTKKTISSSMPQKTVYRRRHSFGQDELAYLPDTKRGYLTEDDSDDVSLDSEVLTEGCSNATNRHEMVKDCKKAERRGMLGWFKPRKPGNLVGSARGSDSQSSASASPASCSASSQNRGTVSDVKDRRRKFLSQKGDHSSTGSSSQQRSEAHVPLTGKTVADQMNLLNEQVRLLAGEIALCTSSLKRLPVNNPGDTGVEELMQKLRNEINEKKLQICKLEQNTIGLLEAATPASASEMSQALTKLATLLNEKTFKLEIKSVDSRILEEQLQTKISENAEMQETILLLRQQLRTAVDGSSSCSRQLHSVEAAALDTGPICSADKKEGKESPIDATTPKSVISLNRIFSHDETKDSTSVTNSDSQAIQMENLNQENIRLAEEKVGLEIHNQKLAEEASYAKELAGAAAVELQNLTEEVTKLSHQNAKLIGELSSLKEAQCTRGCCQHLPEAKQSKSNGAGFDISPRNIEYEQVVENLQKELIVRHQRVALLEAALSESQLVEHELQRQLNETRRQKDDLENNLARMQDSGTNTAGSGIKSGGFFFDGTGTSDFRRAKNANGLSSINSLSSGGNEAFLNMDKGSIPEELKASYLREKKRSQELESLVSRLKGEDLVGLDLATLEELQNVHVEAITKICEAKANVCNPKSHGLKMDVPNIDFHDLFAKPTYFGEDVNLRCENYNQTMQECPRFAILAWFSIGIILNFGRTKVS